MLPKIVKFKFDNKKLLQEAFKIRLKVFVEEQNIDKKEEFDSLNDEATYFLIFSEGNPAGNFKSQNNERRY